MHTATRLALPVIDRVRAINPRARLCAYGLYAPLNAALLREHGVADILGGEFEDDLVRMCAAAGAAVTADGRSRRRRRTCRPCRASRFAFPSRRAAAARALRDAAGRRPAPRRRLHRGEPRLQAPLPPLPDRSRSTTAASASSRSTIVLADVRAQVAAGARHITFGDPDFFNGLRHARELIVRASRAEFPGVTYDVTIKVEHLLAHAGAAAAAARHGLRCSSRPPSKSIDDGVLAQLEKGHTRAGLRAGRRAVPRGRAHAGADVRRVHAVDDARRATASCCRRSTRWISSSTSRRSSSRSGC